MAKKLPQVDWNNKIKPTIGQVEKQGEITATPDSPEAAKPEKPQQETNLAGSKATPKDVQTQKNPAKVMDATGTVELPEGLKWSRTCEKCGRGMIEGFVIDGGMYYYCSEECLHKDISPKEFKQLYNDGDGDSYWTEWYEEEGEWFEE